MKRNHVLACENRASDASRDGKAEKVLARMKGIAVTRAVMVCSSKEASHLLKSSYDCHLI